jgi:predicted TPR repeat methyltransferase
MFSFLTKAYALKSVRDTRKHYDDWAPGYEAEIGENGYASPARCAAALRKYTSETDVPVLDFGCGTGLSGQALKEAGFQVIDGIDLSSEMLEQARGKNIYRNLDRIGGGDSLPFADGAYALVAAVGSIGVGAAPAAALHLLMRKLPKDGKLVLSLNDHTLAERDYKAALSEWTDCGAARLLFREDGPHLPKINLNSTVYVIEKA